ncbi:hypothetical protein NMY22_g8947 [Coprinellus aureogranulatus]|nr:hypothetical protein NMY22_g8947 [Coprinellus aureogranulatus]
MGETIRHCPQPPSLLNCQPPCTTLTASQSTPEVSLAADLSFRIDTDLNQVLRIVGVKLSSHIGSDYFNTAIQEGDGWFGLCDSWIALALYHLPSIQDARRALTQSAGFAKLSLQATSSPPSPEDILLKNSPPTTMAGSKRIQQQLAIDVQITQLERELGALKRQRNELAHISILPPEILCQILLLATTILPVEDWLSFRISSESAALGCPQLWAEIDVEWYTDPRKVDFMVQHAHHHLISLFVKARSFPPIALESVIRAISGSGRFSRIMISGSLNVLSHLLHNIAQPRALQDLQLSIPDEHGHRDSAAGRRIAQSPMFSSGMPGLRNLIISGFAVPLTSPILTQSHYLTCLSLPIPRGCHLTHVLGMLRGMRLLQDLNLYFQLGDSFQQLQLPPEGIDIIDPVPLPVLTVLVLQGESPHVTATLSCLRLSAMDLTVNLYCDLERGANPQQEGSRLFRAFRKARCTPASAGRKPAANNPFCPQLIGLRHMPQQEGIFEWTVGDWLPSEEEPIPYATSKTICPTATIYSGFRKHGESGPMGWKEWHPLTISHHPKDLYRHVEWSMDDLRCFSFYDNRFYPDSLGNLLSYCPKLSHISFSSFDTRQCLALLSIDNGVLPFPSLCYIEMRRSASAARPIDGDKALFDALLQVLGIRHDILSKYGARKDLQSSHAIGTDKADHPYRARRGRFRLPLALCSPMAFLRAIVFLNIRVGDGTVEDVDAALTSNPL